MKSKRNSNVWAILVAVLILVVCLLVLQRQDNINKQTEQEALKEKEKIEHDWSWKVLACWAKLDSLSIVIEERDSLVACLEEQKKQLQTEVYRLQPFELKAYEATNLQSENSRLERELSELRDSISRSKEFEVAIPDSVLSKFWKDAERIKVYPNIFEEYIFISTGIDLKAKVTNIAGHFVKQCIIPQGDKMRINTSDIKSGVYFISFYASYEGQDIPLKTERIIRR